jgi:hypothetical protein
VVVIVVFVVVAAVVVVIMACQWCFSFQNGGVLHLCGGVGAEIGELLACFAQGALVLAGGWLRGCCVLALIWWRVFVSRPK